MNIRQICKLVNRVPRGLGRRTTTTKLSVLNVQSVRTQKVNLLQLDAGIVGGVRPHQKPEDGSRTNVDVPQGTTGSWITGEIGSAFLVTLVNTIQMGGTGMIVSHVITGSYQTRKGLAAINVQTMRPRRVQGNNVNVSSLNGGQPVENFVFFLTVRRVTILLTQGMPVMKNPHVTCAMRERSKHPEACEPRAGRALLGNSRPRQGPWNVLIVMRELTHLRRVLRSARRVQVGLALYREVIYFPIVSVWWGTPPPLMERIVMRVIRGHTRAGWVLSRVVCVRLGRTNLHRVKGSV